MCGLTCMCIGLVVESVRAPLLVRCEGAGYPQQPANGQPSGHGASPQHRLLALYGPLMSCTPAKARGSLGPLEAWPLHQFRWGPLEKTGTCKRLFAAQQSL